MAINHGVAGRTIVAEHPGGVRVVVNGAHGGYVQRPIFAGGSQFFARTYVVNGVASMHYYRAFPFRGLTLAVYAPRAYFSPAFYGWAYRPWGVTVNFAWGFRANPWFAYYRPYFTPYDAYGGPTPWLTDYLLASSFSNAYQQGDPSAPLPPGPPISPQVKDYINHEVQEQIKLYNYEATTERTGRTIDTGSSSIDRTLNDQHQHTFVANADLDVLDSRGSSCSIGAGDTLVFNPPPPGPNAIAVPLQVLWSKPQDCPIGSTISLGMNDLQEMQNSMRATLNRALEQLKAQQGRNGIPALPEAAKGNPVPSRYDPLLPPPDPNAAQKAAQAISEQSGAADRLEKDANAGGIQ